MRRQLNLFAKPSLSHGGDLRLKRRKTARPIDPKRSAHVVLRSERARGAWSFLKPANKAKIFAIVHATAERLGIKIHRFSNVGNHLHLLIKAPTRQAFQSFLRAVSGAIVLAVTGAKKGNPIGRFWDGLAFTRVVNWGRDFKATYEYLITNLLEGMGLGRILAKSVGAPYF